jgi:peptidoglycan/LPS O-acetylase OafA/YrhL
MFLHHFFAIRTGVADNVLFKALFHVFKAGYLGVDFFFTLSGFLITSILISRSSFDLGQFYLKRILRIVPLYLLIVAFSYLVLPHLMGHDIHLPPLAYVLSFTANFFFAFHGNNFLFAIVILWSLSIEMQFYLLWGFVLRFFRDHLYVLTVSIIFVSLVIKYFLAGKCSYYFVTISYMPNFMLGALGAKLLHDGKFSFGSIHKGLKLLMYAGIIAVFMLTPFLNEFFVWKMAYNFVFASFAIAIIIDQCSEGSLFEAGSSKLISHLGKVSYGIYCFQGFVLPFYTMYALPHFIDQGWFIQAILVPVVLFGITATLASISFRYFESWFLTLKERK